MKPRILVIVPAYNEEKSIISVINDLRSIEVDLDICIINDGSTDRTSEVANQQGEVIVIDLPQNLGIGGAVQTGFMYAFRKHYDIAIQFDGDGQHIASELPKLIEPITEQKADVVIGSRFIVKSDSYKSSKLRIVGIKTFYFVNSLLIGQRITDNTSGFRAYNKEAIKFLANNYPTDYPEPEAVILLGKNGFKIKEVFTKMRERLTGNSSISLKNGVFYMIKVLLAIIMTAMRPKNIL